MSSLPRILDQAVRHYRAGRFDETEEICNRVLLDQPEEVNACHLLGMIALHRGDHDDAVALISRAARRDPDNAEIQHNLAQALKAAGRLSDAVAAYERAIALFPSSAALHSNLANTLRRLGRGDDARAAYERAIELDPNIAEIHANLAELLRESGDPAAAIAAAARALRLNGDLVAALRTQGLAHLDMGDAAGAAPALERAVALDPANLDVWVELARLHEQCGRLAQAEAALRRVLDHDPGDITALYRLGLLVLRNGAQAEAEKLFMAVVDRDPRHTGARLRLGDVLAAGGRHDDATACYREAARIDPTSAPALVRLAAALEEDSRFAEAFETYSQAGELTGSAGVRLRLAMLLPIIPGSAQEIRTARGAFAQGLARLRHERLSLSDPLREVGAVPHRLAYHGVADRSMQEALGALYRQACPGLSRDLRRVRRRRGGRLRVGFCSGHLCDGATGRLTGGFIAQLDPKRYETIVIRPPMADDDLTRALASVARTLQVPLDLAAAQQQIAELDLDVLIHPDLSADPLSYFLSFARLARVQVAGPCVPITSGLESVDALLVGDEWVPAGAQDDYVEAIERLSGATTWYRGQPGRRGREGRGMLGLDEHRNLYLCIAPLDQIHPDFDTVLAEILRLDRQGELVLRAPARPYWDELWGRRFAAAHPDVATRIRFAQIPNRDRLRDLMAAANVVLDPLHYSDGDLTLEALSMGVPVVTLPGSYAKARRVYGYYRRMGLLDCVAYDAADYVETALAIATDRRRQATVEEAILDRVGRLLESRASVTALERFLDGALDRYG